MCTHTRNWDLKEWKNYTPWRTIPPLFSSAQCTSVALLIVVIKCVCAHIYKNRTTDSVLCQNQPTVCLFCYQSSKATCGSQSVLCSMHGLAGDAKNAMVLTAVINMTLEIRKFDAGLKGQVQPQMKIRNHSLTLMSFQIHNTLVNLWNTKLFLL